jgi:cytochrome c oxidase assembly protein subunit 15
MGMMMQTKKLSFLFFFATLLAFTVIILGAYTRLTDAGLGCPDWPGCYGQLTAPNDEVRIDVANNAFPGMPVDVKKAQTEMTHRYFAESLGFLIVMLALFSYFTRKKQSLPLWLPFSLVLLVIFQGMLGMWTVTMRLFPLAVMGHLLGGFCTLSLLWVCWLHLNVKNKIQALSLSPSLLFSARLLLGVVFLQILLGGWTSANYAALICPDFPTCQGQWLPELNFSQAFQFMAGMGSEHPLSFMDTKARTTIHFIHRLGALLTLVCGLILAFAMAHQTKSAKASTKKWLQRGLIGLIGILGFQLLLGVSNVVFSLPLKVAMMHNATAALLFLYMITVVCCLSWTQKSHG